MLADLEGRINIDAEYQRGVVWSTPQQLLLIDSILRNYDLPKIFLRKLAEGSETLFDVVDGVQRLTAIWRFLADEITLPRSYAYPDLGDVGGKTWSELPQDAKDRLQFAKVTVSELETDSEDDIRELFQRLQKGEPLNAAEKRNAVPGPVHDFVNLKLAKHPVWAETSLKNVRNGWRELSAIALELVRAGGPTGLKGADLLALYEDVEFDPEGDAARQTVAMLDRLRAVAAVHRGAIRTRWGVVDLLVSLMRLDGGGFDPDPAEVMRFFNDFEVERRAGAVALTDLRSTVMDLAGDESAAEKLELPEIQPDMLSYLNAFSREGATQANVAIRAEVMVARLRRFLKVDSR